MCERPLSVKVTYQSGVSAEMPIAPINADVLMTASYRDEYCTHYKILDYERRVPELIRVLGSQPAGDVSHKPSGRLPLLSARPAVTPATLKRVVTNFAAW